MYKYDEIDQAIVDERVAQYRDQVRRFLAGELTDDEFRPLRLQNGLYIQRHAPMLRIAVPYGTLSSPQLHKLADIAKRYDRGYGHFSTRQNLQLNWPKLEDTPDILAELATVQMHAIQTSGNCIRNITTDQFAGIAPDEIIDPRAVAEIMRQWSTFHPEFALLPRKFKIAVSGTRHDRAIVQAHDIGLEFYYDDQQKMAIKVWVGGGLGRTPILGSVIREHLEWQHVLTYCEAIIRVYNLHGRRDNAFKARIKILVKALGIEEFRRQVEEEWQHLKNSPNTITEAELARVSQYFTAMPYETLPAHDAAFDTAVASNPAFAAWVKRCVHAHKVPGYRAVTL
jgi:sulfite reductase (NADPH) hemoprotein beta-component